MSETLGGAQTHVMLNGQTVNDGQRFWERKAAWSAS